MTGEDNVTNSLIYTTLRDIQERLAEMDNRLTHGVQRVSGQISAMDSHMAGFYQSLRVRDDDQDDLRGRVEALENTVKDLKGDEPKS